ncbi:MAG: ABC transporter substrate-binding protein [Myxococcota bacterium]
MNRRTTIRALAACGLFGAVGCTGATPPAVTARWLSLSPQITETAFALGASLVGRSTFCVLPPQAEALPSAGTALTPDLEAIVALGPTGILVEGASSIDVDRLAKLAPVEVFPWLTKAQVVDSVQRLGSVLGVEAAGKALAERITTTLSGEPAADAPRVLLALAGADLGRGTLYFIQPGSLHGAALTAAGFHNAVPGPVSGPPQMSLERLIELDPHTIVVLSAQALDEAALARVTGAFAAIEPLAAAKAGRIAVLHGPGTLSTGPSILDLPARIAAVVKPGS